MSIGSSVSNSLDLSVSIQFLENQMKNWLQIKNVQLTMDLAIIYWPLQYNVVQGGRTNSESGHNRCYSFAIDGLFFVFHALFFAFWFVHLSFCLFS